MSKTDDEIIYRRAYRDFWRNAGRSGIDFLLTREEAARLFASPCHYCGQKDIRLHRSRIANCNGIDRVDNTLGYIPGNMVAACRICNRAKSSLPEKEYRLWIDQVVSFRLQQELMRLKTV